MEAKKECLYCQIVKNSKDFYDHPETASKKMGACKDCCKQRANKNYQKNKKQKNKLSTEYRLANPEKNKESCQKYRSQPENKIKKRLRALGMSNDEIANFLISCPKISEYLINWSINSEKNVKKLI